MKHVMAAWSDLNPDVLSLVMMRLGVVDFVAFSGVCKAWRSLASSNKNRSMTISTEKESCHLEDFQGRKFKTILPDSSGRTYVGLTCGYLVFYRDETHDFLLLNPITRDQLHFPDAPFKADSLKLRGKAILVFSPSISGWVLVVIIKIKYEIWFSIADKGAWTCVSTKFRIRDIHAFNGRIYTLDVGDFCPHLYIYEMRLGQEPTLMLLETKNFPFPDYKGLARFVSWGENLCMAKYLSADLHTVEEFDFWEMKWVRFENTKEKKAFFIDNFRNQIVGVKRELWWLATDTYRESGFSRAHMWYFPHECLNVSYIDE